MVHELLTITNARVDMGAVPGIHKDAKDIFLAESQDTYFAKTIYTDFGEISSFQKQLLTEYTKKKKVNDNMQSMSDMKNFVEGYAQFRAMGLQVTRHTAISAELSRIVKMYDLFVCSEVEQDLACQDIHKDIVPRIREILKNSQIPAAFKLRVVSCPEYDDVNNPFNMTSLTFLR